MRLIDADALKKAIRNYYDERTNTTNEHSIVDIIDNAPTVETPIIYEFKGCDNCELERPKGKWNYIQAGMCVCPFCGATPHKEYKDFCPKCGADMRGEEE